MMENVIRRPRVSRRTSDACRDRLFCDSRPCPSVAVSAVAASRPTVTHGQTPKPRPRTKPRPGSFGLTSNRAQGENRPSPNGSMQQSIEVVQMREQSETSEQTTGETFAEPVYAQPQKKQLKNAKEPQIDHSTKSSVSSLSPTRDQSSTTPSPISPVPSPSGERRVPRLPIPYSEHKRMASPGVVRKADTIDTVPTRQPSFGRRSHVSTPSRPSDKIDNIFSRPRLPTPKLETMIPQPYKQRASSVSSTGSSGSPRSRSGSRTHETGRQQSSQGAANEQSQVSLQHPVPAQKPRDRPRPARRPKTVAVSRPTSSVTDEQPYQSVEDRLIEPIEHRRVQSTVNEKERPAESVACPTSTQKSPPVPAPRSAVPLRTKRAVDLPGSPPRRLSNLEPGEESKRPDGSPVTRPKIRPKPTVKPKRKAITMYEKSSNLHDHKASSTVQLNETRSAERIASTATEILEQKPVQTKLDNGLNLADASEQIPSSVPEASLLDNTTAHLDSSGAGLHAVANGQYSPIMAVQSFVNPQLPVETPQPTESLESVVVGSNLSLGCSLVTSPCNSQDDVFEGSATPVEETVEKKREVGIERRPRSGTATRFLGSIASAAAKLQSALLGGSSETDESSLVPEDQEGGIQQPSQVETSPPVLSPLTSTSSDCDARLSPSKQRRKAPPRPANGALHGKDRPSPASSPSWGRKPPLSQSEQTPSIEKLLPAVDTASSPGQSPSGKRRAAPPPPPTRVSSIEIENALSGPQPVNSALPSPSDQRHVGSQSPIKVLSTPTRPRTSSQSLSVEYALPATSPVTPGLGTRATPSHPPSSGPPSRPPPKPPRSPASQNVLALSPDAHQQQPQFPPTVSVPHGRRPIVQQSDSVISMASSMSILSDEDSDGWGSEFESDSQEEEVGPLRPKVYHIAREIVTTEETFVRGLYLLHVEFRGAVSDPGGKPYVGEETMARILQNTEQLFLFNSGLLTQLQKRIEKWDACAKIGDIMKQNAPFLRLYTPYIQNFDSAMKALDDATRRSSIFEKKIREFERKAICNNLPVSAYMLETVQRIPRYKLLLNDYIKHLPEDSNDKQDATDALAIVSSVAAHVNEGFKKKDNFQRVLDIQRKLTGKGSEDIVKPGREFLKQGKLLKVCRKDLQPRVLFLFSDVLLYTHELPAGQYGLDSTLPLTGMRVAELLATQYKHAFTVVSTRKSFQLLAETEEERDDWLQSLKNAIRDTVRKQVSFDPQLHGRVQAPSEVAVPGQSGSGGDFVLGEMAPVWISDDSVSMCMGCMTHFTVTRRRHHCRSCGKVLCGKCSSLTHHLNYLKKIARVCSNCFDALEGKEMGSLLPSTEREEPLGEEEPEESSDVKSKVKRRKSLRWQSKRKPVGAKLPTILTEVQARDANAQMSGYLYLRQGKGWKRRWFVAHNMVLYTYKRHEDIAAIATMPLLGYRLGKVEKRDGIDKKDAELALKLDHPGTAGCILKTDTEDQFEKWWYVLELAIKGEMPPAEQQDDSEQCQSPDIEFSLSVGSPASDPDTAFPAQLSPVDMATVSGNSMASPDSGVYSYATVTPMSHATPAPATRSPKSPHTPTRRGPVYEEVANIGGGQYAVVGGHDNQMEEAVMNSHENIPYEPDEALGDGGGKEAALGTTNSVADQQYEIQGNPLYSTIELMEDRHTAVLAGVSSQANVGLEDCEVRGNPLYQSQSDVFQHHGPEDDSGQFSGSYGQQSEPADVANEM